MLKTESRWQTFKHLWYFTSDDRELFLATPLFFFRFYDWGKDFMTKSFQRGWKIDLFPSWKPRGVFETLPFRFTFGSQMKKYSYECWEDSGKPWPPDCQHPKEYGHVRMDS